MRVLILSKNLDLPEAYLYRGLADNGVELTIVLDKESPFQDVLSDLKAEMLHHSFPSRFSFKSSKWVREIVFDKKIDLIHSFSNRALSNALFGTRGSLALKHVAYRGTVGHLSRLDPTAWMTFLNPRLDKIICVSDAVYAYLISKRISPTRLVRIYKGHDLNWYAQKSLPTLEEFGIPQNAFVIATSATIRPVKGIDILVDAFRAMDAFPRAHLLLIGDNKDTTVEKEVRAHPLKNRIHLVGFRKDATNLCGAAQVFCMPSREREGLPKAVIEAMAQGVPAIVSKVGGMPELVTDGVDGFVVPPSDGEALGRALLKCIENENLLREMGREAKGTIEKRFNIKKTIEETLKVYRELI